MTDRTTSVVALAVALGLAPALATRQTVALKDRQRQPKPAVDAVVKVLQGAR